MTTTAYDMKDALIAEITESPEFIDLVNDDAVQYGGMAVPSGERPEEVIWVGEIEWVGERDKPAPVSPAFKREEHYEIMVVVESHHAGDTQREANQRVKVWHQRMETLVGRDFRWASARGITGIISIGLIPQMLAEGADADQGRGAILILALEVKARKT